jgi:hypothetical protein
MNTLETTEKEYLKVMLEEVLKSAKPTIYTSLRHCSRSGMSRSISVYLVLNNKIYDTEADNYQLVNIDCYVEKVTGRKRDRNNGGLKIGGCGMDMGFALIDDMLTSMRDVMGDEFKHGRWQSKFRHTWM